MSFCIGLFATATQDIVPYAADLADDKNRGAVAGRIMTGLLGGILLSRTLSGFISDFLGWRVVFYFSGLSIAVIGIILFYRLELKPAKPQLSYLKLLQSTLNKFIRYPELPASMFIQ